MEVRGWRRGAESSRLKAESRKVKGRRVRQ